MNEDIFTQFNSLIGLIFAGIFFLIILVAVLYVGWQLIVLYLKYKKREEKSLDSVMLEIAVPRDNEVKIDAAEQFFSSLSSIHKSAGSFEFGHVQETLSFEIVATPGNIRFYVMTPKKLRDLIEKQIHGMYPSAQIREVDEYNIFTEHGKVAFAALKLKSADYYPIKNYKDLPVDPLATLTSSLAKMQEGEGAAIQVMIQPAGSAWSKAGKDFISKTKKNEADPEKAKFNVDSKTLEAIDNKINRPGFDTVIRVVVSSTNQEIADMHLNNMVTVFSQFSSSLNNFTKVSLFFKNMFMVDFIYRYFPILGWPYPQSSVLSSEELASVFHFPNKTIETPGVYFLHSKRSPAPANIPTSGLYIGKSIYRGLDRPVYISKKDRQRHMYIIGKTGTGKSELLKDMALQDIRRGEGIAMIDPHGETIEKLLPLIPPERAEDVIYFNPGDLERPMGLNLLEAYTEHQKHFIATSIIGLMYKLFDPQKTGIIGPRFEHAVRNGMLTVMEAIPGATFIEVVQVLSRPDLVQQLLPRVTDPIVRRYWTDQIAQTTEFHKSEVLDYIVSKFGRFVTNKMMRNIIGQSKSAFDFRKVMDERKILLVNLSKGEIGEENSNFLGLVIIPKILVAALSRADIPEDQRRDFYLYVDEFQNFATSDFAIIMSEARKYHLALTVANQFIGQMDEEVKNAVFGNVGTIVSFRVGVTDAGYLQHEFQPVFSESDLINVEAYNAFVKTIVNNEPVLPFSVNMFRDMKSEKRLENPAVAEAIKKLSSLKYGRDRAVVESEITQRARL